MADYWPTKGSPSRKISEFSTRCLRVNMDKKVRLNLLWVTIACLTAAPLESRAQDVTLAVAHRFGIHVPQKFENGMWFSEAASLLPTQACCFRIAIGSRANRQLHNLPA